MSSGQAILRAISYAAFAQGLKPKDPKSLDRALVLLEKAKSAEPYGETVEPDPKHLPRRD